MKSIDWKWLIFMGRSVVIIMIFGIENLIEKWTSMVALILFILYPLIIKGFAGIGIMERIRKPVKCHAPAGSRLKP
ncbi:MAG: hypothetical protein AB1798_05650 [Spirochaetota bacterium]